MPAQPKKRTFRTDRPDRCYTVALKGGEIVLVWASSPTKAQKHLREQGEKPA